MKRPWMYVRSAWNKTELVMSDRECLRVLISTVKAAMHDARGPRVARPESVNHEFGSYAELVKKLISAEGEIMRLRDDQADWRKGIALIASALGEPDNLSCASLAELALEIRAKLEPVQ